MLLNTFDQNKYQKRGMNWCWIILYFLVQTSADANNNFTLRGFGTLGFARSTTDKAEFVRDLSQPDGITDEWSPKIDSILGLQANFQFSPLVEAISQVVSRYHSDGTHQPELMWGFIKFDPNMNFTFRLGRLGSEFYMMSDSRLVGYSYVTVRPSNDYFGGLPFSYVDGADALFTLPLGNGLARGKFMAGWTREDVPTADLQFSLDHSLMLGGYFDYQRGPWQWRLGYSQLRFHNETPAEPLLGILRENHLSSTADELSVVGTLVKYHSLGIVYDSGPLNIQLMLSRTYYENKFFDNYHAGYLLGSYRIAQFKPFAGFSWTKSSSKSVSTILPPPLDTTVATLIHDSYSNQHTFTFGTRWDFADNLALKVQWDIIRGGSDSEFPYRWEMDDWTGHTNIFSIVLDFIF